MNLGPTELIIILVIVMLLFGASRLPKLARSLGQASKEFKDGVSEGAKDAKDSAEKAVDKIDGKA
jgi:sec-independent protein translocase protein TatA